MCIGAGLKFLNSNNLVLRPNDLVLTSDNRKLIAVEVYTTGHKKPKFKCRLYNPSTKQLEVLTPSRLQPGSVGHATPQQLAAIEALLNELTEQGAMRKINECEEADDAGADEDAGMQQQNTEPENAAPEVRAERGSRQSERSQRCAVLVQPLCSLSFQEATGRYLQHRQHQQRELGKDIQGLEQQVPCFACFPSHGGLMSRDHSQISRKDAHTHQQQREDERVLQQRREREQAQQRQQQLHASKSRSSVLAAAANTKRATHQHADDAHLPSHLGSALPATGSLYARVVVFEVPELVLLIRSNALLQLSQKLHFDRQAELEEQLRLSEQQAARERASRRAMEQQFILNNLLAQAAARGL